MKFPYLKLLLPQRSEYFGLSLLKPITPIKINADGKELRYAALIDSGADFCIFDAQIADILEVDVEKGEI
ncbi:hypothetical protein MYX07_00060 [Patescibacteria group bacterium AH-259-L07]|nr:hypothetical protein [Patescibacteria group bacterium AH-259-L07]